MEQLINLHIEKLPEGFYLATSDDIQGLVAQGRTITETMEIARDIAKKIIESKKEKQQKFHLSALKKHFDLPLVVSA